MKFRNKNVIVFADKNKSHSPQSFLTGKLLIFGLLVASNLFADSFEECFHQAGSWWNGTMGADFSEINSSAAIATCEKAIEEDPENGDLWAFLARALRSDERWADASEAIDRAIALNSPSGYWNLGVINEFGYGKEIDLKFAFENYKIAANMGYTPGMFNLANAFLNGMGTTQSTLDSIQWYEKAAQAGYTPAYGRLGAIYLQSDSYFEDWNLALQWFLQGVHEGDDSLISSLKALFIELANDPNLLEKTADWFIEDANRGSQQSQLVAAQIFLLGRGRPRDFAMSIEWLLQALNGNSADIRARAAQLLGWLGHPQVMQPLVGILDDDDHFVRAMAVNWLGNIGDTASKTQLLELLHDSNETVRNLTIDSLYKIITDDDSNFLLSELNSPNELTRISSIQLMGRLQKKGAVKKLSEIVINGSSPEQYAAIEALGLIAVAQAVGPLEQLILNESTQDHMKIAIINALGQVANKDAARVLSDVIALEDFLLSRYASSALAQFDQNSLNRSILEKMSKTDVVSRTSALSLLEEFGDATTLTAPMELIEQNGVLRGLAAKALGSSGSPNAVKPLVTLLKDPNLEVQLAAISALSQLGSLEAVPKLIEMLDRNWLVTQYSALALGSLGDLRAELKLLELLDHADDQVRIAAIIALGELGSISAIDRLLDGIVEGSDQSIAETARALGKIGDSVAVPELINLLSSQSPAVRRISISSLGKIGDNKSVGPLIELLDTAQIQEKLIVAEALGGIGGAEAVSKLRELLSDPNALVQQHAIRALLSIGDWDRPEFSELLKSHNSFADSVLRTKSFFPSLVSAIWTRPSYMKNLELLAMIWKFKGIRAQVSSADFSQGLRQSGLDVGSSKCDPYLCYFFSTIQFENGRYADSLKWAETGLMNTFAGNVTLEANLSWLKAQSLREIGSNAQALEVLELVESQLLPNLIMIDRLATGIPFDAFTHHLRGTVLSALGRETDALDDLALAVDLTTRAGRLGWISEETVFDLNEKQIGAYQARAKLELAKTEIESAQGISIRVDNNYNLRPAFGEEEKIAQRKNYETMLEASLLWLRMHPENETFIAAAQLATEQLALKFDHVTPAELSPTNSSMQLAYERHGAIKQQIEQIELELATTRRELIRSADVASQGSAKASKIKIEQQIEKLNTEKGQARAALQILTNELKVSNPAFSVLVGLEPVELSELQPFLQNNHAIVQYLLLEESSWAFIIEAEQIRAIEIELSRREVQEDVQHFFAMLESESLPLPSSSDSSEEDSISFVRRMSEQLLSPLHQVSKGIDHIIFVPNGPLHALPFAALWWKNKYLIESYTLSTISMTSLAPAVVNRPFQSEKLIAFGNSSASNLAPLNGAEQEVNQLARYFQNYSIYPGVDARKETLISEDLTGKVVHLAVHAQAGDIEDTQLFLSDGNLKLDEVYDLNLENSPLVVLSGCETNLGTVLSGDDIASLANGFIFSGARAVVSTLWQVSDPLTAVFIVYFYQGRAEGPSIALANAQREFINRGKSPYFWSGFILTGW